MSHDDVPSGRIPLGEEGTALAMCTVPFGAVGTHCHRGVVMVHADGVRASRMFTIDSRTTQ